ncbi:MAG: hypothetical protein IT241_00180 [Bacteroidia bacterium]|nr:hypothetical protein [Bacteroidia bacterium]
MEWLNSGIEACIITEHSRAFAGDANFLANQLYNPLNPLTFRLAFFTSILQGCFSDFVFIIIVFGKIYYENLSDVSSASRRKKLPRESGVLCYTGLPHAFVFDACRLQSSTPRNTDGTLCGIVELPAGNWNCITTKN